MKQAVMYGGGNIGRGFIGATLSQSGYKVTFIDVAEPVVKALQEKEQYPVRYVSSEGHEDVVIEHVTAVNGNDQEAASEAIANCDIMATAVGARILRFIVGNIVAGLRKRWARDDRPLNIIICENLMDANKVMEGRLKDLLTDEEKKHFDEKVGLVEASIGRMVPVQTEEMKDGDPMRVCVERYGFLPVDKAAFKGEIPEITNMVPFEPFDFYIKRKLYVHNMGHATCAYLGGYEGRKYIYQSIDDPEILNIVQNAMLESALALSKKYGVELDGLMLHITDLLGRFRNAALKDTCKRVGGDPTRKLGAADRLIGSSLLCLDQGVKPAYIAVGAAGAVYRYLNEAGVEQSKEEAAKVLKEVSGLEADSELAGMILEGEPVSALRRAAQAAKTVASAASSETSKAIRKLVLSAMFAALLLRGDDGDPDPHCDRLSEFWRRPVPARRMDPWAVVRLRGGDRAGRAAGAGGLPRAGADAAVREKLYLKKYRFLRLFIESESAIIRVFFGREVP